MTFPGTRSARAAYPPEPPTAELVHPGGSSAIETAFRRQQQVREHNVAWRNSFPPNVDPQLLKDSAGAYADSVPARQLGPALVDAQREAADAAAKVADLMKLAAQPPDDTNALLRAQAFWRRTERQLDAIRDPGKLTTAARELVTSADDSDVSTLLAELGPYMSSRNVSADWVNDAVAQRVPGVAEANAESIKKQRALSILGHNHQGLVRAFAKDTNPPELLSPMNVDGTPYRDGFSA